MTWQSTYNATFVKPLIRQIVAVIQRDQRAALDWVGGANVLPGFVSYQLAPMTIPQFPAILVQPLRLDFDQDAVGSLKSKSGVGISIAVQHQDRQVLQELIEDYIQAVDAIMRTLPLSDFYTSLLLTLPHLGPTPIATIALQAGSMKELFVASHDYNQTRQAGAAFQTAATLKLFIDREET